MNETKRFAAVLIMAGFTFAVYYYIATEKETFTLQNGTTSLNNDETSPPKGNHQAVQDSVSGDQNPLSHLKYDRIESGMTYAEVYAILQSHGIEFHRDEQHVVYQWTYGPETLLVTFRDKKVSEKRFTGNPERVHSSK